MSTRKTYEAPSVVRMGTFESLTQQTNSGASADVTIVAGQPLPPGFPNILGPAFS